MSSLLEQLRSKYEYSKELGNLGVTMLSPEFQQVYEALTWLAHPDVKALVERLKEEECTQVESLEQY